MRKNIGLVLIVTLICAMLLSACGKEVVTDPVPTEPAVTTTASADEAVTEAPKPEVKTEVEDVKPTEEVKEEFDANVKYSVAEYVKDGIFFYHDYAKSIGDDSDITVRGEKDSHRRAAIRFNVEDWYIQITTSDFYQEECYLVVGNPDDDNSGKAVALEYGDNIKLYDKADAEVAKEALIYLPSIVEFCKSTKYSAEALPTCFSNWEPALELTATARESYLKKDGVDTDADKASATPAVIEPEYDTVIEKYIADGDFTTSDAKKYVEEMGVGSSILFNDESGLVIRFGDYTVQFGSSSQDPKYAFTGIVAYHTGVDEAWTCLYDWTNSENINTAGGSVTPKQCLIDFEKTLKYMQDGADPKQKPTVPIGADTPWMTWDETMEYAAQ